jgi:hypothetical protein
MGPFKKLTQTEIILSDNSIISVLENNFLFKVKKQFICLIAKKFYTSLTIASTLNVQSLVQLMTAAGQEHTVAFCSGYRMEERPVLESSCHLQVLQNKSVFCLKFSVLEA